MTPLAALRHPGQGHNPGILCCSAHCSQGKNEMQIHGAALSGFLLPGQISSQAVVPRPCPQAGRSPHVPKDRDVPLGPAVWYRQNQRHHNQDRTLIIGAGEVCTAALISCGNVFHRLMRSCGTEWFYACPGNTVWGFLEHGAAFPCMLAVTALPLRAKQQVPVLQVVFAAASCAGKCLPV